VNPALPSGARIDAKIRRMHRLRKNHRFRRFVITAIALLLSNVAVFSCAMAYAICAECPEHEPALCADPCAPNTVAIADGTSDAKSDLHRPLSFVYTGPSRQQVAKPTSLPVLERNRGCGYSSPPLNLQFCVFLK
jgi:hypothetical protein